MKHLYFCILLLITVNFSNSQAELGGDWFLYHIYVDQTLQYNTFDDNFTINFSTEPDLIFGGYILDGLAICNEYFGSYSEPSPNSIEIYNFNRTLAECNSVAKNLFELDYFSVYQGDGINYPEVLSYNIDGEGTEATLTIQKENGDYAVYQRQSLSIPEFNNSKLRIIKNPVNNILELNSNSSFLNKDYIIFSIDGKRLEQGRLNKNMIDVKRLRTGLYFLKIESYPALKFIKK